MFLLWWFFVSCAAKEERLGDAEVYLVESQEASGSVAGLLNHNAAAGCLDRADIVDRFEGKCVAHDYDAWNVCAKLRCRSVLCLPASDFFIPYNQTRDATRATALRAASMMDDAAGVRRELSKGVDVDAIDDRRQRTPLMLAALEGALHTSFELLKAGASPLLIDTQGRSALDLARFGDLSSSSRVSIKESHRRALITLLESATKAAQLVTDRLDQGLITSELEARLRLRASLATHALDRNKAKIAADQLHNGVNGPLCLFASTAQATTVTNHSICDANATFSTGDDAVYFPARRCHLHVFNAKSLAETLDLDYLPSFAARKISNARRERNTILVAYNSTTEPFARAFLDLEDVASRHGHSHSPDKSFSTEIPQIYVVPGPPLSSSNC